MDGEFFECDGANEKAAWIPKNMKSRCLYLHCRLRGIVFGIIDEIFYVTKQRYKRRYFGGIFKYRKSGNRRQVSHCFRLSTRPREAGSAGSLLALLSPQSQTNTYHPPPRRYGLTRQILVIHDDMHEVLHSRRHGQTVQQKGVCASKGYRQALHQMPISPRPWHCRVKPRTESFDMRA